MKTADTDKTSKTKQDLLSCLCRRCEHSWRQDKTLWSCLNSVSNFHVFSSPQCIWDWSVANWKLGRDKTKLSCLVANFVHTADTDKTRQFCLVHVGDVNKLLRAYAQSVFVHLLFLALWRTNIRNACNVWSQTELFMCLYGRVVPAISEFGAQQTFLIFSSTGWAIHIRWSKCCLCVCLHVWVLSRVAQIVAVTHRDL